jgi:SAM-dependent methyltransferase
VPKRRQRRDGEGRWGPHVLDAESRYWPAVAALPDGTLPICEVGSGPSGVARWTDREVIGVDPGDDDLHVDHQAVPNLRRLVGTGNAIPLDDASVIAAVAVDTMEHVMPDERAATVAEMVRVTASGGRVILIGPTGPAAVEADRWLLETFDQRGGRPSWAIWLSEHQERGVPTVEELMTWLSVPRVRAVSTRGILRVKHWKTMHLAAMGARPRFGPLDPLLWQPFADFALHDRRGPFYRQLVVADIV